MRYGIIYFSVNQMIWWSAFRAFDYSYMTSYASIMIEILLLLMNLVRFSRFDYNFFGVEHNSPSDCSNFGVSIN